MSGNDFLNKNVLRWRWKVDRDAAEVISSGSGVGRILVWGAYRGAEGARRRRRRGGEVRGEGVPLPAGGEVWEGAVPLHRKFLKI